MLSVNIQKQLGKFRLDVAFEAENEVFALLGASGCGKSMTLKCIAGIETPDSGRIVLDDRTLFDSEKKINLTPQKRRVGYLFQQFALFPNMTVEQNIAAGARHLPREARAQAVAEKIRVFQLSGLEKKRPHQLSGGQQQRVALARILINEPALILLDEPFSALDSYLKWQLELELTDTLRDFGGTAILVSHSRDEVYRLSEHVCVLSDGKSQPQQAVRDLFETPATLAACLLSGCKNYAHISYLPDGKIRAEEWGADLTVPADAPRDATWVGIRAHYILLGTVPTGKNCLPCRVDRVIDDVFSTVVMLATPGGSSGYSLLRAELSKEQWAALGNPETLYATLDETQLMLLYE